MNAKRQEMMNMAKVPIFKKSPDLDIFPNGKQHTLHGADCSSSSESENTHGTTQSLHSEGTQKQK